MVTTPRNVTPRYYGPSTGSSAITPAQRRRNSNPFTDLATSVGARAAISALSNLSPAAGVAARVANTIYQARRMYTANKKGRAPKFAAVDTGKYVGRFRKRRVKEGLLTKMAKNGVTGTIEQGGQLPDGNCVYIGHTTAATWTMAKAATLAVLRKLFQLTKLDIQRVDEPMPVAGTWVLQVQYVNPIDNSAEIYSQNITSGDSMEGLANTLAVEFAKRANASPIVSGYRWKAQNIQLVDGNGAPMARYDLYGAKITFFATSALKVQNSSFITNAGDEDDDNALNVNNVPLVGKGYYGIGAGMFWKGRQVGATPEVASAVNFDFTGNPQHGLIAAKAGVQTGLQEPPLAKLFQNVKGCSGNMLQPGHIKKDIINYKCVKYFNKYFEDLRLVPVTEWSIVALNSNDTVDTRCYAGKFRVYALEKQIHSTTDSINVRAEVNYKYGAMVSLGPKRVATSSIEIKAPVTDLTSV